MFLLSPTSPTPFQVEFTCSRLSGSPLALSMIPWRLPCTNSLLLVPPRQWTLYRAFWGHHNDPDNGINRRNAELHTQLLGSRWDRCQLPRAPLELHETYLDFEDQITPVGVGAGRVDTPDTCFLLLGLRVRAERFVALQLPPPLGLCVDLG